MQRRSFLIGGLATLFAAPSIVRASSLMQIRGEILRPFVRMPFDSLPWHTAEEFRKLVSIHGECELFKGRLHFTAPAYPTDEFNREIIECSAYSNLPLLAQTEI